MDFEKYQEFAEEKLGFRFNDINLLVTALTHRSFLNENKRLDQEHNERLEFLGDAVLELITSDFLYRCFEYPEGIMTAMRSALVRTEAIGAAGKELGYGELIRLSKGEKRGTERAREAIAADCFEAVLGAVYLDQGYEAAKKIVNEHILDKIEDVIEAESWRDAKSYLQELTQKVDGEIPVYRTLKEDGPDHDKHFTIGLYLGGHLEVTAEGHSKQEAQEKAALIEIKRYKKKIPANDEIKLTVDRSKIK